MTTTSIVRARELRDEIQRMLESRYHNSTTHDLTALSRPDFTDSAGLCLNYHGVYLEVHIYANMEEDR